jgi:hypothetical protein
MLSNSREILIAHERSRGELKGVRRMLVQSTLAELEQIGAYEHYCARIDPLSLGAIVDQIGPGWLPIELAMAHYRACDAAGIEDAEVAALHREHRYRVAHQAFMRQSFKTLGANAVDARITNFRANGSMREVSLAWE